MKTTTIKASEIRNLSETSMLYTCGERKHYKFLMSLGRVLPTTRSQAKHFLKENYSLGVLCMGDVNKIEALFARNGHAGECQYRYTKNESFVRLDSVTLFEECLRKEFNI